jgi:hypothetical protein
MSHVIAGLLRARIVQTITVPATDTTGTRVLARVVDGSRETTVAWDHALDVAENHCAAAMACLKGVPPASYWPSTDGYMFAF